MSKEFKIRTLSNNDATAIIGDYGAHVMGFIPQGQQPVLWMPREATLAPGIAIRGGVPVIFPWFGTGPDLTRSDDCKPRHGCARLSFWKPDAAACDNAHARYTLDPDDCDPELMRFMNEPDLRFHAVYDVTVGERLTMALTVSNTGDRPLTYEAALHTYFHVGDVERTLVQGLEDATYLDNTRPGEPHQDPTGEPISFTGMVDRTFTSDSAVRIEDAALGRTIMVEKSGAPQTVVWNPGETAGAAINDMEPDEWQRFVCVEAAARLDHRIVLNPGESHTLSQTVYVA